MSGFDNVVRALITGGAKGALAPQIASKVAPKISAVPTITKPSESSGWLHALFSTPDWLKSPSPTMRVGDLQSMINHDKAKELGFNKLIFHSTKSFEPFEEFKPGDIGIHGGTIRAASDRGAMEGSTGIIPLLMRSQNPLKTPDLGGWHPSELANHFLDINKWDSPTLREIAEHGSPYNAGPNYSEQRPLFYEQLKNDLRTRGFDSIKYRNTVEDPGSTSYIALDPSQLRVPWAKFDPKNMDSGNIYAGLAGGGMALPTVTDWLKNYQQAAPQN